MDEKFIDDFVDSYASERLFCRTVLSFILIELATLKQDSGKQNSLAFLEGLPEKLKEEINLAGSLRPANIREDACASVDDLMKKLWVVRAGTHNIGE